jgi:hypothetical protein
MPKNLIIFARKLLTGAFSCVIITELLQHNQRHIRAVGDKAAANAADV